MIHNKELIKKRFSNSLREYNSLAQVQRNIAEKLCELIPRGEYRLGLEIGAGSGFLTRPLVETYARTRWVANDITAQSRPFLPTCVDFVEGDGEQIPIPDGVDLIATASTIQWFDDVPRFLGRAYSELARGGVLAFSTFGEDNFCEIPQAGLEYMTMQELSDAARDVGFEIVLARQWHESLVFETPLEVLHHIKATGVNAVKAHRWSRRDFKDFVQQYPHPAVLTFHPIIMILCKN